MTLDRNVSCYYRNDIIPFCPFYSRKWCTSKLFSSILFVYSYNNSNSLSQAVFFRSLIVNVLFSSLWRFTVSHATLTMSTKKTWRTEENQLEQVLLFDKSYLRIDYSIVKPRKSIEIFIAQYSRTKKFMNVAI